MSAGDVFVAILFGLGVIGWLFDRGADEELEHQRAIGDELVEWPPDNE